MDDERPGPQPAALDLADPVACARSWSTRRDIRWRALELGAFDGHPAVQHLLDRDTSLGDFPAPPVRSRRWPGRSSTTLVTLELVFVIVVFVVVMLGPLAAAFMPMRTRYYVPGGPIPIGEPGSIPIATAILACYVPVVAYVGLVLRTWVDPGREAGEPTAAMLMTIVTIAAPIATLNALLRFAPGDVAHRPVHAAVPLLLLALAVIAWVRRTRARAAYLREHGSLPTMGGKPRRRRSARSLLLPARWHATHRHLEPVLQAIAALSAAERQRARTRLHAAVDVLEQRGLLSPPEAAQARAAQLGLLSAEMPNLRRASGGSRD